MLKAISLYLQINSNNNLDTNIMLPFFSKQTKVILNKLIKTPKMFLYGATEAKFFVASKIARGFWLITVKYLMTPKSLSPALVYS